jgi:hypothetical protein
MLLEQGPKMRFEGVGVARWHILKIKIPDLGKFCNRICWYFDGHMYCYFTTEWYIL